MARRRYVAARRNRGGNDDDRIQADHSFRRGHDSGAPRPFRAGPRSALHLQCGSLRCARAARRAAHRAQRCGRGDARCGRYAGGNPLYAGRDGAGAFFGAVRETFSNDGPGRCQGACPGPGGRSYERRGFARVRYSLWGVSREGASGRRGRRAFRRRCLDCRLSARGRCGVLRRYGGGADFQGICLHARPKSLGERRGDPLSRVGRRPYGGGGLLSAHSSG